MYSHTPLTSRCYAPRAIEEVLDKVFRIKDPNFAGIAPKQCAAVEVPDEEDDH